MALACFLEWARYEWLQMLILLAGSIIVIIIGLGLLRAKGHAKAAEGSRLPLGKTISTACVVTWFNPQAIIDGTMMLGAFHVTLPPAQSGVFISGVAAASCLWFLGLTILISIFRSKLNEAILRAINIICGVIIIFYGLKLLFNFITTAAV